MPVFKCIFKIINKSKVTLIVYICIFTAIVFMIASSVASDNTGEYSESPVPIAIVDRDGSKLSKALTEYLSERHKPVDLNDDVNELQDALFYRNVEYILFIPKNFEKDFINGGNSALENVKLPGSMSGVYIDIQIDRYITTLKAYTDAGYMLEETLANTAEDLKLGVEVEMIGAQQSDVTVSDFYFQYLGYILLSLVISALGPVLIVFNRRDLMQRTECSSFSSRKRNNQKILGIIIASVGIWLILMIFALIAFDNITLNMVYGLQILNSLALLLVSIMIALLTGNFIKGASSLAAFNNAITLGMSFLCGVFVPQELLGEGVLAFSKFLPVYWFARNNDMLAVASDLNPPDMQVFIEGIIMQVCFAAAIFSVSLVLGRQKNRSSLA